MPRTKKQKKLQKRCWNDEEEVNQYKVVAKNSILYEQPIQTHSRVVLYGDVIIDVNAFIQNQNYLPRLQDGLMKVNKVVKLIKEQQLIFYTESIFPQLIDFTSIIKLIKSISSEETYQLAQRLDIFQAQTNRQLKQFQEQQNNKANSYISLHYDPETLLNKCQQLIKQNLDYEGQLYAFNLYTFDPQNLSLNRYLSSNNLKLLALLSDDEEELKRRFLNMKLNQPQGDNNQFIKIQIPLLDQNIVEDIKIYTIDNYIISGRITQSCLKLSENSNNSLMIRKYTFDPAILQELKRVRSLKRAQRQQIHSSLVLDQYTSSTCIHSSENLCQSDDSFNIQTFLLKYEPTQGQY